MSELRSIADWVGVSANGGKFPEAAQKLNQPEEPQPALEGYQVKTVRELGGLLIEEPEA